MLARQCLDRRIESYLRLVAEVPAWQKQRNVVRVRITWTFATEQVAQKWTGLSVPGEPNKARRGRRKESKPLSRATRKLWIGLEMMD